MLLGGPGCTLARALKRFLSAQFNLFDPLSRLCLERGVAAWLATVGTRQRSLGSSHYSGRTHFREATR